MKIRNGFVSNSSSSSFVIITNKESWDRAVKKFTEKVGENVAAVVTKAYGRPEPAKILGQNALVYQGVISSEEYGCDTLEQLIDDGKITEDESWEISQTAYESQSDFEKILVEDGLSYCGGDGC